MPTCTARNWARPATRATPHARSRSAHSGTRNSGRSSTVSTGRCAARSAIVRLRGTGTQWRQHARPPRRQTAVRSCDGAASASAPDSRRHLTRVSRVTPMSISVRWARDVRRATRWRQRSSRCIELPACQDEVSADRQARARSSARPATPWRRRPSRAGTAPRDGSPASAPNAPRCHKDAARSRARTATVRAVTRLIRSRSSAIRTDARICCGVLHRQAHRRVQRLPQAGREQNRRTRFGAGQLHSLDGVHHLSHRRAPRRARSAMRVVSQAMTRADDQRASGARSAWCSLVALVLRRRAPRPSSRRRAASSTTTPRFRSMAVTAMCRARPVISSKVRTKARRTSASTATGSAVRTTATACSSGSQCEQCHRTTSWTDARWDHAAMTGMALGVAHRQVTCQACHTNNTFRAAQTSCVLLSPGGLSGRTHAEPRRRRIPDQCEACHRVSDATFNQARFDHAASFPLVGVHAQQTCASCHKGNVFKGTPRDCVGCHRPLYDRTTTPNHVAAELPDHLRELSPADRHELARRELQPRGGVRPGRPPRTDGVRQLPHQQRLQGHTA